MNPQAPGLPPIVTDEDRAIVQQMQNAHIELTNAAMYFAQAQAVFNQWISEKNQSRIVLSR